METEGTESFLREFRRAMASLPTGVSVLTILVDEDLHAMTAGSVVLASFDPPLVAVFVMRESRMHGHLSRAGRFAISVLPESDSLTARRYARRWPGQEPGLEGHEGLMERASCPPVVRDSITWLDCEVEQVVPVGDHSCFVGRVMAIGWRSDADPLVYVRGRFHSLGAVVGPGLRVSSEPADLIHSW